MSNLPYVGLINNTALLLVMGALYGSLSGSKKLRGRLACGIALGLIGVAVMLNSWEFAPGIIFDARAIVLSVGGLFLGFIPTFVAMIMTGLYRIYAGGAGALTGVAWVVVSGLIGVCWGRLRQRPAHQFSWGEFYLFGVVVQFSMLMLLLTLPSHLIIPTLIQISLPIMVVFPIGTVILAKLLAGQEAQIQNKLALDKSERQYRELVQYSQAIILRLDGQGRCLFVNDYAQEFFGFARDEMLGKSLNETIVPETDSAGNDLQVLFSAIAMKPENYPANENENVCRDGRRVQILWKNVPVRDASGKVVGTQSIGHDVTEQRQAEVSLRAAERQFHRLIEVSPVPLAIQEQEQTIVYVNRKFTELFGYTLEDIPTLENWSVLAYPDEAYRENVKQKWNAAASKALSEDGEFEPQEFRVTCKDGKVRDIVFMVSSVGGQNVVMFNDMTQERDIDRMKSEFIATAAHELNTPLTTIAGFTELLLEGNGFDREQQKEYLSIVYEKTQVLERLIEDLLNLDRVESGRGIHLKIESCDIRELITSSVKSYQKEFSTHRIALDWPESVPRKVVVDSGKIGQVVENLLSNAMKYSPCEGTVHVSAEVIDREIKITVRDEGIGMTPEQVSRIFERFYRVDLSDTAVSGMGLGMAIVKNIIDAHGGWIWVESALAKGTTVSFTMPMK